MVCYGESFTLLYCTPWSLGLHFNPEDGDSISLRNVSKPPTQSTTEFFLLIFTDCQKPSSTEYHICCQLGTISKGWNVSDRTQLPALLAVTPIGLCCIESLITTTWHFLLFLPWRKVDTYLERRKSILLVIIIIIITIIIIIIIIGWQGRYGCKLLQHSDQTSKVLFISFSYWMCVGYEVA
jgi:hypothetical protein